MHDTAQHFKQILNKFRTIALLTLTAAAAAASFRFTLLTGTCTDSQKVVNFALKTMQYTQQTSKGRIYPKNRTLLVAH